MLGIWQSYPFSYYGDEMHFVERSLSFGSFDFNPHWFHKPAGYMYFLFFEYGLFFLAGKLAGAWQTASDFAVFYVRQPGAFFLIGRITTALFSLATVSLTYELGRRLFERRTALLAALFLGLSFGHVVSSQHVKADSPMTFLNLASMYFLLVFLTSERTRDVVIASGLAGLGAATKYIPLVMLGPIWVGVALVAINGAGRSVARARQVAGGWAVTALSFWLTYFVASPYNFLDSLGRRATFGWAGKLWSSISRVAAGGGQPTAESAHTSLSESEGWLGRALDYLQTLVAIHGLGPVIGTLGLVGLVVLLTRATDRRILVFLLFPPIFFLGSLYLKTYHEPRHQLPLYPFLAIAGAWLIGLAADRLARPRLLYVLLALALLQPAYSIVQRGVRISRTDTRSLAKAWIEANVAAGTKLVLDEEGPPLTRLPEQVRAELKRAAEGAADGQFTAHYDTYLGYELEASQGAIAYEIFELRFPWWRESIAEPGVQYLTTDFDRDFGNPLKPVGVNSYDFYLESGFEYAVVHSERYTPWLHPKARSMERYPGFAEFYRELFSRGLLVKEFDPEADGRPGPVVKVIAFQ